MERRIPILAKRAEQEAAPINIHYILPNPAIGQALAVLSGSIGDPKSIREAVLEILVVTMRLLSQKRNATYLRLYVYFVDHASEIRFDITDDLITMSAHTFRNPFIVIPKGTSMFSAICQDVDRLARTSRVQVSTEHAEVKAVLYNDLALAQYLIRVVLLSSQPQLAISPEELVRCAHEPLKSKYPA